MKRGHTSATGLKRSIGTFRREGEYWTIEYAELVVRLRDTKGLRYLGHLLHHPGRAFDVRELAGVLKPRSDGAERMRKAVTNRIRQAVVRIGEAHQALGLHLGNTVHTGARCIYTPEGPARWEV
jgi:hypothetical protein